MRLALITRRYPPLIGGAEKVLSYLASALADAGADVTVLTSRAADLPSETPDVEEPGDRHRIVRLGSPPIRMLGTWIYMRNLRRELSRIKPDLAYVSMLKHDAYETVAAGKRLGFPVVLRPEGAGETGDLAWQRRGRFGQRIGTRCKEADRFVAISKPVKEELIAAGHEPSRIVELPNGVPVPRKPWTPHPDWRAAPSAIFVGRLAREKGLDVLLEAWPIVRSSYPAARLTLVGEGPERPALEERVRGLGLSSAVSLPGLSNEPGESLRSADLFVLPSREEGMSVALLEAMALGVPLVVTSIPGNRRLVSDFKTGRLAKVNDPEALGRAIVEQWQGFDRARRMAENARKLVETRFSIAACARDHLALFETLIRKPVATVTGT